MKKNTESDSLDKVSIGDEAEWFKPHYPKPETGKSNETTKNQDKQKDREQDFAGFLQSRAERLG
jgi:hypothetical protein